MRRIAIINQKGGVGKTTTAVNLGAALARLGQRVVVIDMDPQANASMNLGAELAPEEPSTYSILTKGGRVADTLRGTSTPGLSILPSHRTCRARNSGSRAPSAARRSSRTPSRTGSARRSRARAAAGRHPHRQPAEPRAPLGQRAGRLARGADRRPDRVLRAPGPQQAGGDRPAPAPTPEPRARDHRRAGVPLRQPPAPGARGPRRAPRTLPGRALQAAHRAERQARRDAELRTHDLRVRAGIQGRRGLHGGGQGVPRTTGRGGTRQREIDRAAGACYGGARTGRPT